jgi:ABC-type polysaccharide/polyol phosphate transport system ATPase subunit
LPTYAKGTVAVEHVWKRFRADRHIPLFREHVARWGKRVRGNKPNRDWRWVLRDVNIHVEPGKTCGIIGVNGSGKSTLLKMICQTTFPTVGRIDTVGRIGALLDVRSAIHPDLTGEENIYLYGTILGLSRPQIKERFDPIVEFAEIGEAIDRQIKFYSTGMAIRLGFAISAFLEPEVLLVDEVLAVGDARFQQKCLERITTVVNNGATLFYVSHDLPTVEAVCERAVWLADGYVRAMGPARDVVNLYRSSVEEQSMLANAASEGSIRVLKAEVTGPEGEQVRSGEPVNLRFVVNSPEAFFGAFHIGVSQGTAQPVFVLRYAGSFPEGEFELNCRMHTFPLPKGRYSLWSAMRAPVGSGIMAQFPWQPVASFEAFGPNVIKAPTGVMVLSPVYVPADWELN